jgi:hypothetical protein
MGRFNTPPRAAVGLVFRTILALLGLRLIWVGIADWYGRA